MEKIVADVAIIGSGAAGQTAAIQAAKLGRHVVIVEQDPYPGGACLNSGTIPSKSLREAIIDLTRFNERRLYTITGQQPKITIEELQKRLNQVLEEERRVLLRRFTKNKIHLLHGFASFVDPHTLQVGPGRRVHADAIIIATGSSPRNPHEVPFDDEVILDSTRLLSIKDVPKSLLVLGGGIVGSEYASFFAALGCAVTVLDKKSHMLPLLDSEIGVHLQTALSDLNLIFHANKRVTEIQRENDHAVVLCADGTSYTADKLLYALGRKANVEGLGLERLGIALTDRGFIPVNELFQTHHAHLYAVGDVVGGAALASTSMEQGRLAALHACNAAAPRFPSIYPLGIYTIPEISCLGRTEDQAIEEGLHYEVGRAYYYEIARGHISGSQEGMVKLIFHAETLELLGIHIIGRAATELIHVGQAAMSFNAHLDFFINNVFNYPTFAEGYRIAALNGINKILRPPSR
jgi:NAD(P) transhydrogenase